MPFSMARFTVATASSLEVSPQTWPSPPPPRVRVLTESKGLNCLCCMAI